MSHRAPCIETPRCHVGVPAPDGAGVVCLGCKQVVQPDLPRGSQSVGAVGVDRALAALNVKCPACAAEARAIHNGPTAGLADRMKRQP